MALESAKAPHFPAELARIVAACECLPDAIKAAILTLVEAAAGGDV
ncbi:MAG: hypothetical protein WD845_18175 [Pirellulales bacterium]